MSYFTIKHIKGNPYLYEVHSEREGDTVRQVFDAYWGRADGIGVIKRRPGSRRARRAEARAKAKRFKPIPTVTEIKPTVKAVTPTVAVEAETPQPVKPIPIEEITPPVTPTPVTPEVTNDWTSMTWYRGTKSQPIEGQTVRGDISYFTNVPEVAKGYAKGEIPGRVIEAELLFKNPKIEKSPPMVVSSEYITQLKKEGYDALIQDTGAGRYDVITFEASQVKSKPLAIPKAETGIPEVTKEVVTPTAPAVTPEVTPTPEVTKPTIPTPEEIQWRFPTADDFYFWARKNNLSEQQTARLWNEAKEAKKILQGKKPPPLEVVTPEVTREAYIKKFKDIGIDFDSITSDMAKENRPPAEIANAKQMFNFMADYARIADPEGTISNTEIASLAKDLSERIDSHLATMEGNDSVAWLRLEKDLKEIQRGLNVSSRSSQVIAIDHLASLAHQVDPSVIPQIFRQGSYMMETPKMERIRSILDNVADSKIIPSLPKAEAVTPTAPAVEIPKAEAVTPEVTTTPRGIGRGIPLSKMDKTDFQDWVGNENVVEGKIKVYRGLKGEPYSLRRGDFVTTNREYAKTYGENITEHNIPIEELNYFSGVKGGDPKLLGTTLRGSQPTELIYTGGLIPKAEAAPVTPEVTMPEMTRLESEKAVQSLVNELRVVRQQRLDGKISQTEFLTKQRDIAQRVIEVEPLDIAKETWRGTLQRTEKELAVTPTAPAVEVEIGDFVRLKGEIGKGLRAPRGFVESEGIMGKNIPAWKIRQADDTVTLIAKEDAEAVGKAPAPAVEPIIPEPIVKELEIKEPTASITTEVTKGVGSLIAKYTETKMSPETGLDTEYSTEYRVIEAPEYAGAEWMGNPYGVIRIFTKGGVEVDKDLLEVGMSPEAVVKALPFETSYKKAEKFGLAKTEYEKYEKGLADKEQAKQAKEREEQAGYEKYHQAIRDLGSIKGIKKTDITYFSPIDNTQKTSEGFDVGQGVGVVIHKVGNANEYAVTHINTGLAMGHNWKNRAEAIALAKSVATITDWSKYSNEKEIPQEIMTQAAGLVRGFTQKNLQPS